MYIARASEAEKNECDHVIFLVVGTKKWIYPKKTVAAPAT
jgi:hypothetical protein